MLSSLCASPNFYFSSLFKSHSELRLFHFPIGVLLCHHKIRIYFQNGNVKLRDVTVFTLESADAHRHSCQKFTMILSIRSEIPHTLVFRNTPEFFSKAQHPLSSLVSAAAPSTVAQGQHRCTENEAHTIRDPLWKVWCKELAKRRHRAVQNLVVQGGIRQ